MTNTNEHTEPSADTVAAQRPTRTLGSAVWVIVAVSFSAPFVHVGIANDAH